MQNYTLRKVFVLTLALVFIAGLFLIFSFKGENDDQQKHRGGPESNFTVNPPAIPDQIEFAGEAAPLDLFYVRESFERELLINTYWHSSTILLLKRANRWFPVIEPILNENNIPDDFKYLALIESGFIPIVSPKGAAGFWQFLDKTGKEYGLEINDYVDERYNVEKATEAACRYFQDSFDEYGSWTLVAAAYNAGKRRITESLEQQKTNSYYELYLNDETSRYIYRIMAIKTICNAPENYSFYLDENDLYQPLQLEKKEINQPIESLVDFAQQNNISYKMLKELNPWLRNRSLPNSSGKTYWISLPKDRQKTK